MTKKKNKQKQRDTETAAELTPDAHAANASPAKREDVNGTGLGITALTLSLLAFFLFPFLLSFLGIVLGVAGGRRGSTAGWWAVGIGAFVLLIRILAFPILAIF